jgi:microcystin-dependent protein
MPLSTPPPSWASIKNKPANFDVQPGFVEFFATNTAPTGWLKANGAAISRSTYAALFAAIGTTYGAGDGSTTFNVPDLRGEFVRSLDDGRGVDSGRGIGTAQSHQMQTHTHNVNSGGGGSGVNYSTFNGAFNSSFTGTTSATGGTSNSSENRPRNVAMQACIKY